jgi:Ca-activated chloride channel family protein
MLIDQIRQMKATPETAADSSATKELVEQIVALSKKFGILTEYTAFLAEEGTNLADTRAQNEVALRNFSNRLHRARAGIGAANQQANISNMRAQQVSRLRNAFYDANMRFVQITTVQQIGNRALFRRGNQWIDSQILHLRRDGSQQQTYKPDRIIKYGTPEFEELLHKLSVSNDQGLLHLGDSVLFHLEGEVVQVKF